MDLNHHGTLPSIQRNRPIDASGLFWALVSILAGFFYGEIYSVVCYFIFGVSALLCVRSQFRTWASDMAIDRQATQWCQTHYPEFGGTPIVDFLVGLAHVLEIRFDGLTPTTPLVHLILPDVRTFDAIELDLPNLLRMAGREARLDNRDYASFTGLTLDDAIRFVAVSAESSSNTNPAADRTR